MGGGDRCFEIVGNYYGVVYAEGDSFCWNLKCKQVGFGTRCFHEIDFLIPRVMVYPETVLTRRRQY
jgi:hypothetical protein